MDTVLVQVVLLLAVGVVYTAGVCNTPSHPQQSFCESAWAIKGTVLKYIVTKSHRKGEPPIERNYLVKVEKVFKQPITAPGKGWKKGSRAWISTDGDMGKFGVSLKAKETYLLSGIIYDDRAFMSKCNWIQPWGKVERCHKAALISEVYLQNCICTISTCVNHIGCFPPEKDPGCTNYNHDNTHEVCVYDKFWGVCGWSKCGIKKQMPFH